MMGRLRRLTEQAAELGSCLAELEYRNAKRNI